MAITTPQNRAQLAGMPGQWADDVTTGHTHLYAGDTPLVVTEDLPLALNQTLAAYTPVAWNAERTGLVAAADGEPAIGITLYDITVAASGDMPGVPIVRAACLNVDGLNWPASYTTEAKKFDAFRGAEAPTNIVLRKVYRGSIVAQP